MTDATILGRINLPKLDAVQPEKFHVYALEMDNGTVKIGIAKDVEKRANTVSHNSGAKILNVYHTAPAVNARQIELQCHKTFAKYRTHGEFFKIPFTDACAELDKHADEINSANIAADEKYLRDVETAWENYYLLDEKYSLPKSDLVFIGNGQILADSRKVAEYFGKRHDNILRVIEKELTNLREISAENPNLFNFKEAKIDNAFIKGEYKDEQGKPRPMYYLNRDAFAFVVMGFTGKDAALWKWNYIQEFNRMEAALQSVIVP